MNQRDRDALDRHITGNFGEDQVPDEDYPTDEQIEQIREADLSLIPTRFAVICPLHGRVYLTRQAYVNQLHKADERWKCPRCGQVSAFDDESYEREEED